MKPHSFMNSRFVTSELFITANILKPSVLACAAINVPKYDCPEVMMKTKAKTTGINDLRKKTYEKSLANFE
jgi:hypothetical protein